jgi:general stress protein 26
MSPTALQYEETLQTALQLLKKNPFGVLATASEDRVTARQMMLVFDGLRISCFTPNFTRKYRQISANRNVALVSGNVQVEGIACIKGRTSEPQNAGFLTAVKTSLPRVYEHYRDWLEDPNTFNEVIDIIPTRIAVFFGPPEPNRHLDVLNIDERTCFRYYSSESYPSGY